MTQLAKKPFALIGVSGNNYEPKKLKGDMDKEKLNWRSFADHGAISTKWGSRSTPAYYVIDHRGVIRYKWLGYPGVNSIDTALEKLILEAEKDLGKRPK